MLHAADGILISKKEKILLIKRSSETYKGYWALPGGIVEEEEAVEDTLIREMKEEVGIEAIPIEILGVFSDPNRDPRGRIISTVFICRYKGSPKAGSDASQVKEFTITEALNLDLAFDHSYIIQSYSQWLKHNETFWSKKFLQKNV